MKKLLLLLPLLLCYVVGVSQITVDETLTTQQLVEDVLIQNSCATVSNFLQSTGTNFGEGNGIGAFDRNGSVFPFDDGIILSSGFVANAPGPNATLHSDGSFGWPGDADLEANTSATNTNNASWIQFDFVPFIDQISFDFIMASEEYNENFECSFSDAFAFILTDQVTGFVQNLAVLPGTTTPIEVTNIRYEVLGQCAAINEEYFGQYNFQPIANVLAPSIPEADAPIDFNGQTVSLTAMGNVVSGNPYTIKLVVADETDAAFDIAVFLEAGSFSLGVDLGDDLTIAAGNAPCEGQPLNIGFTPVPGDMYNWYRLNPLTGLFVEIPGTMNMSMITITNTGTYKVVVTKPSGCSAEDEVYIEFAPQPIAVEPDQINECDELPNDGFATFDLTQSDAQIMNGQATTSVIWYETLIDAQDDTNAILDPTMYVNTVQGFQTVYARLQEGGFNCFDIVPQDIQVNDSPPLTDPVTDYIICDNDEDGLEEFDLTSKDGEIANILVNLTITYHTSQADAEAGVGAIATPGAYISGGEIIWARGENIAGCYTVVSFSLILDTIPLFVEVPEFRQCDNDGDGVESFDLNTQNATIVDGDLDLSVTYHPTELDADDATNELMSPYVSGGEVIWVRVESNSRGCYGVFDMELIVVERPDIFEPDPLTICDDNNDGFGEFTLTDADDQVVNGNPAGNLVVSYHETLVNAQNNVDPLASPYLNIVPFNQTVYVRLSDTAAGCYNVTTLDLIVLETPEISDPSPLEECDTDGDGVFVFNLTDAEPEILAGLTGGPYVVNYYEDPALTIAIANTTAYPNISNPQTLFVTVSDTGNSCLAETTLELIVNLPPSLNEPMAYTLCDENDPPGEEMEVFDLTSRTAEITGGNIGIVVSFYESLADAQAGTNAIATPEAYTNLTNPQNIYIRGENATTGCEQTGGVNGLVLELRVDNIPDVEDPTPLVVCDMDNDGFAQFDLTSKDAEIAGGDPSVTVTYHETLLDAQDGVFALTSPYQNIVADMQTVYARAVFSMAPNTNGCFDIVELDLIVLPSPTLPLEISPIIACESGGTAVFDLTEREVEILNGQDPLSFTVSYYELLVDAQAGTNAIAIPTAYANTSNPQTIYVRVSDNTNLCAVTGSFEIEVREPPMATQPIPFTKCDDLGEPNDGIASFDLTTKDVEIAGAGIGINVSYYLTPEDAQDATNAIDPATAYVNQDPVTGAAINPQTIYVRVDDVTTECEGFTSMTLRVVSNPEPVSPDAIEVCDINDPNDGVEVFDLTIREAQILNGENWTLEYYETFTDAVDQTNVIGTPGAYPNISNPQIVYVRVTNGTIPEMCFEIVELELIVNPLPDASAVVTPLVLCQAPNTGFGLFNLTDKEGEILGGQDPALFTVSYYESAADAAIMFDPITTPGSYTNLSNPQTIYVGIQNIETECYIAMQEFELRVDDGATATTPAAPYAICDNTDPNDGIADFTLDDPTDPTSQAQLLRDEILGGQDPTLFLLTYHETLANAEGNIDPLGATYTNIVNPQVIYARVSNSANDCFAITEVILKVEQLPILALDEEYRLCVDADGLPIEAEFGGPSPPVLDTGLSPEDYIFLWELNGAVLIGEVGPSIIATQEGVYVVTVTERVTGCMQSYTTTVILSSPPTTFDVDVTTGAFAGEHAITATAQGLGTYQFQLDDGAFQDEGMFNNVAPGSHTVTIQDINGCGSVTVPVGVVDYPRFMTPNLDGYHDTWNIIGIADADPTAKIYIFDRHGKLLKQISPTGEGWDGTFNGNPLPSNDYWFVVEYTEDETQKEFRGHFTLKR
ncbi:T9SS type B sorting domain-containing protein [Rasiella rasia]|uniref:T9SS type B sorting domain-containing protein n=1 Tax=Rasiella rasia TaxID=2744027 RepID=A0A6G6GNN9_9FLAO|nr:choice-of-anchor L domain-containing protein [Rasiella rasia]QIE60172.1 T9SS type B sorting domain-containing protein [Rasiella rasia]